MRQTIKGLQFELGKVEIENSRKRIVTSAIFAAVQKTLTAGGAPGENRRASTGFDQERQREGN